MILRKLKVTGVQEDAGIEMDDPSLSDDGMEEHV